MDEDRSAWFEKRKTGAIVIAALLLFPAVLTLLIPVADVSAHNILHHLNFLPLMIAGMLFGWRGALLASISAAVLNAPIVAHHWERWPIDAKDQIVELTIFSLAGLIAGHSSDRERAHRRHLEKTQQELQKVYLELSNSVTQMKKTERLSAAGQLAASLAHEIRNPLASISGAAGILQRGAAPQKYVEDSLEIIQKESQRLNKLLTGFLNFATPRAPRLQRTKLNDLLQSVISLVAHNAKSGDILISYDYDADEVDLQCDPEQLKQVILNLLINAIDVSPASSEIRIRSVHQGNKLHIEVEDQGTGIPPEATDRIFDPFFTTKPNGTGLGLAISSMIVRQHNGDLSFGRNLQGGTTFRIELPMQVEHVHAE